MGLHALTTSGGPHVTLRGVPAHCSQSHYKYVTNRGHRNRASAHAYAEAPAGLPSPHTCTTTPPSRGPRSERPRRTQCPAPLLGTMRKGLCRATATQRVRGDARSLQPRGSPARCGCCPRSRERQLSGHAQRAHPASRRSRGSSRNAARRTQLHRLPSRL